MASLLFFFCYCASAGSTQKKISRSAECCCYCILISVVLLQSGKSSGVAGALSGNSDTFLSKNKANSWDGRLARITKWVAFVFMFLVLVLNFIK